MAKVLNPLNSTEARGRVGGLQYNTWRGSRYVKVQTSPAQPRSALQLTIRAWCANLVRMWQGLDAATRVNWNAYAVAHPDIDWTNSPKRLTGANWYVRCNMRMLWIGKTPITEPPAAAAPNALLGLAAANGVLSSALTWTSPGGTGITADVYAYGPHSAGMIAKINRAKCVTQLAAETATCTISGLRPGTYTFWIRAVDEATGLASPTISDTAVITAA